MNVSITTTVSFQMPGDRSLLMKFIKENDMGEWKERITTNQISFCRIDLGMICKETKSDLIFE